MKKRLKHRPSDRDNQTLGSINNPRVHIYLNTYVYLCLDLGIPITKMCLPLGTIPNTLSITAALTGITCLSLPCAEWKDTTGPSPTNLVCFTTALNNPEEKQSCSLSCLSVRDSHKYLFKEWKTQIHQSQVSGSRNKLSTDRGGFWLPICSSHSALRQWCRDFLRISRSL